MSTPRQDRKQYLQVLNGSPLSEQDVTQTLLARAGVDDEELAGLIRESIDELKGLLHAKTYLTTMGRDRTSNVLEINDNGTRIKAIDMLLKLTSSYPKTSGKGPRAPIYLQMPGYYEAPDDKPSTGNS